MIPPARGWQRKTGRLFWMPLIPPVAYVVAVLILLLAVNSPWAPAYGNDIGGWLIQVALASSLLVVGLTMLLRIQHRLHDPLSHLRSWALRMRGGNLGVRLPVPADGEFRKLASDINDLSDRLQLMAEDMDRQVRDQTARLAQKNQSLEVLYDVAASLNETRDLDDLLTRFLHTVMKVVGARAATVRLLTNDGYLRLVASIGADAGILESEHATRVDCCLSAFACEEIPLLFTFPRYSRAKPCVCEPRTEMVIVPLQYGHKTLGVYNLFTDGPALRGREDMHDLLISIGRHLGMAVEKTRLDTESHRLALMQERNMLAHELHDSLAQSLASLRMQTQMLDETLQQGTDRAAQRELERIKMGMDAAYRQLRELLTHCRAPMDERGLMPAVEDMVEQFRRDTGMTVFLQKECRDFALPPEMEVQVLHIVQESLTNIRKHSHARHVRVLLRCDHDGNHQVLVEDDGLGIIPSSGNALPGEHLGLHILHERAHRLGGTLAVESEPGDGTRLSLMFRFIAGSAGIRAGSA